MSTAKTYRRRLNAYLNEPGVADAAYTIADEAVAALATAEEEIKELKARCKQLSDNLETATE